MSVVKKKNCGGGSTKKRKVGVDFRDLIDFEMPLWRDVFSVVFQFLSPNDLKPFIRASKTLYELVKERAVFSMMLLYKNNDITNNALRNFYFRAIKLCFKLDDKSEQLPLLLRQRFLDTVELNGYALDFRVFLRRNINGRLLFPSFQSIFFTTDNFDGCCFWDFLERFPKPINFAMSMRRSGDPLSRLNSIKISGSDFRKLATLGKFGTFKFYLPFKDDTQHKEINTSYLKLLCTIEATRIALVDYTQNSDRFFTYVNALKENKFVQELQLGPALFRDDKHTERFLDIIGKDHSHFPTVTAMYFCGFSATGIGIVCQKVKMVLGKPLLRRVSMKFRGPGSGAGAEVQEVNNDNDEKFGKIRLLCDEMLWNVKFTVEEQNSETEFVGSVLIDFTRI